MPARIFYLHFRNVPATETLSILRENGFELHPVFETSFDVVSPVSYSAFKHLLKSECPNEEYNIVRVKCDSQIIPLDN